MRGEFYAPLRDKSFSLYEAVLSFVAMGDFLQAFCSYLASVFYRSGAIDTDSPLAKQTRWIGYVFAIVFLVLPGLFLVGITYFPEWVSWLLKAKAAKP